MVLVPGEPGNNIVFIGIKGIVSENLVSIINLGELVSYTWMYLYNSIVTRG